MKGAAADWVAHYAHTQPDAPALRNVETGEERTWRELDVRVGQIAHLLLHDMQLKPGDRIVNLSDGDLRHFEMQFACIRAGLVWIPLNFRHTVAELSQICGDLRPALMLTDEKWALAAEKVVAAASIPRNLLWGASEAFEAMLKTDKRVEAADVTLDPDCPIQVLFTSGTTGKPKAVAYSLGSLTWHILNQLQHCATGSADNHVFVPIPLFHAGGLHSLANPSLYAGGQVTVSGRFDPAGTLHYVGNPAHRVTHLALVPVMFQMMADSAAFAAADFSYVRRFLCAGGRLSDPLRSAYAAKGVSFMTQYGGTETGPTVTSLNPARIDKLVAGSCGQKAMYVEIRLVDELGDRVSQGELGEIWVRGPAIAIGYLGNGGTLTPMDGWLKTGDVAYEDDEGFFYIVDRVKDMYKSGGENVFPAEVERVLVQHPAVTEAAVIGVANDRWGEVGLAIIVTPRGEPITLEELRRFCDDKLARYKQPQHLMIVDALPRNVTGKISKQDLREIYKGSKSA